MSPGAQLALVCIFAAGAAAGFRAVTRMAVGSPEKRERRRRQQINRHGRLGEAFITEVTDSSVFYKYTVRGVQYETSQDIAVLRDRLPADPEKLIGLASLKYSPKNPANSIIVCEEWSGLRKIN
jgi:hypothetical protein